MHTFIDPADVHPPAAGYSHHVVIENERLLITSGQIGMHPDGTLARGIEAQMHVAFDNLAANLSASDMTMTNVVKLTIYLVGPLDAQIRRRLISQALGPHRPTMTVLYVAGLGTDDMKVEIEAIASGPKSGDGLDA